MLIILMGAVACSDAPSSADGGLAARSLEIPTPPGPDVGLAPSEQATLRVRYLEGGNRGIAGAEVRFAIFEDPRGSTLSSDIALTDQSGLASVQVHAGAVDSRFRIVATAAGANEAVFYLEVSDAGFGAVALTSAYDGELASPPGLGRIVYALGASIDCSTLDPRDPPLLLRTREARSTEQVVAFADLPLDLDHTIAALGYRYAKSATKSGWQLRATGCTEILAGTLQPERELHLSLELVDLPPKVQGSYSLTSSLSLPAVSRPLASLLRPWADLVDCPHDPVQLLLDCVLDALDPGDPADCVVEAPSPQTLALMAERGGLAGGCRGDTTSRAGVSLERQLVASLDDSAKTVSDALREVETAGAAALRNLGLNSTLTLQPIDPQSGRVAATHRLDEVVFSAQSGQVTYKVGEVGAPTWLARPVSGLVLGEGPPGWGWQLQLEEHVFSLQYGQLARKALGRLVLASLQLPETSAEIAALLIDLLRYNDGHREVRGCAALEAVACKAARLPNACLGQACAGGQAALATYLDQSFAEIAGQHTDLRLKGQALLKDDDLNSAIDALGDADAPGIWTAQLLMGLELVIPQQATFHGH